ncbi:hypothetical protein D9758_000401 [Tetrapyrgos nigripes]|uniref:UreD-domain-containing protein n=1 Tax=Tetrapyrgos nigripes TaxID=182062 RepID=A0A8H5H197_9AGAR|nr:hypothetical protein D9758_000401 [Tetrapyrgos nigripes]
MPPSQLHAGGGRIVLSQHNGDPVFAQLSSTYPLKLLSPRVHQKPVAVVYALTYGGGLVSGDQVHLSAEIDRGVILVFLTQGSTKVFKTRGEQRLASVQRLFPESSTAQTYTTPTIQKMDFRVSSNSVIVLLPDPVTCFRAASYSQIQTFHLTKEASAVVLDWMTSGRRSLGEEWVFSRYSSCSEIIVEGTTIAKDVILLEADEPGVDPFPRRTLAERMHPYSCYATVLLCGTAVRAAIEHIKNDYEKITVMKSSAPANFLWSFSLIRPDGDGAIVRVAGKDTETVKEWLKAALSCLEEVIGIDVYRRAFV